MNEPAVIADHARQLSRLVQHGQLPQRARTIAERLLRRLSTPVRVTVTGHVPQDNQLIAEVLADPAFADMMALSRRDAVVGDPTLFDTDLIIWCTRSFDLMEARFWSQAPDRLKDRALMVGLAPDDPPALLDIAEAEFSGLALLDPVDDPASVAALRDEIGRRVRAGIQADQDYALVFLDQYKGFARSTAPESPPPPSQVRSARPAVSAVVQTALACLDTCAADLATEPLADSPHEITRVLSLCSDAAQSLSEMLADATEIPPRMTSLCDDILRAADDIVLMSVEDTLGAAVDAVTTLLQIHKDLRLEMAA